MITNKSITSTLFLLLFRLRRAVGRYSTLGAVPRGKDKDGEMTFASPFAFPAWKRIVVHNPYIDPDWYIPLDWEPALMGEIPWPSTHTLKNSPKQKQREKYVIHMT